MIEYISKNVLKETVKLEQKKYRDLSGQYLIFGDHLILEAIKYGAIEYLILTEEAYKRFSSDDKENFKLFLIDNKDLTKFKCLKSIPDIIGVCNKQQMEFDSKKIVALNRLSNPGNVGTIIRTSKAFGINNVLLDDQTVDIYNPKTIQAMQGVHFSMNILKENIYDYAKMDSLPIITTFLDEVDQSQEIKKNKFQEYILIFGNEAQGIEEKFKDLKHYNYKLQIDYESLNVAIASGIIIYEMTRG